MVNRYRNWEGHERPFFSPFSWPRWLRIAFVVTLPVSGPAWLVGMTVGMLGYMGVIVLGAVIFVPMFLAIEFFERD